MRPVTVSSECYVIVNKTKNPYVRATLPERTYYVRTYVCVEKASSNRVKGAEGWLEE